MPLPLQRHVANRSAATQRAITKWNGVPETSVGSIFEEKCGSKEALYKRQIRAARRNGGFLWRAGFSYGRAIPSFCIRT
jgi:hypothetical protein